MKKYIFKKIVEFEYCIEAYDVAQAKHILKYEDPLPHSESIKKIKLIGEYVDYE